MLTPVEWRTNAPVAPATFRRYLDINVARGLEEVDIPGKATSTPLYIVCSGPSLRDTWHELENSPGEIWALNSAFDWLREKGIKIDRGICIGPENEILNYFQTAGQRDKFLFGYHTHPELVDRALDRGGEVTFWHLASPEEWGLGIPKEKAIHGGGTVGTRAIDLAYMMGYRDIHILGMDGCVSVDGRLAVDRDVPSDIRDKLATFICNGRAFVALGSHARQIEDFHAVLRPLTGLSVTLYGDGMLQWSQTKPQQEKISA